MGRLWIMAETLGRRQRFYVEGMASVEDRCCSLQKWFKVGEDGKIAAVDRLPPAVILSAKRPVRGKQSPPAQLFLPRAKIRLIQREYRLVTAVPE